MKATISRRHALSALAAGTAVAIAGCGSDETTDDSESPTSYGDDNGTDSEIKNGGQEGQETENVLFIAVNETHVIDATETYDAVEIEPNGALELEQGGCLEFGSQN